MTWAVFDRDEDVERQNPNDRDDFIRALKLAKKSGIEVAYSNDAFGLWLLLHFQDVSQSANRKELDEKLKKHLPGYCHGKDIYQEIKGRYEEAVGRAKRVQRSAESRDPVDANPSTTVYMLTEELLKDLR